MEGKVGDMDGHLHLQKVRYSQNVCYRVNIDTHMIRYYESDNNRVESITYTFCGETNSSYESTVMTCQIYRQDAEMKITKLAHLDKTGAVSMLQLQTCKKLKQLRNKILIM